jgi:creatinine amidohydrolase/Fe(II)-dependent formamide hydrolase-like protein
MIGRLESEGRATIRTPMKPTKTADQRWKPTSSPRIRKDRIVDCVPGVPRDYLNYGSIFRYSKAGVWGKPSLASKEKGRKIFELLLDMCVRYVNDVVNLENGYKP